VPLWDRAAGELFAPIVVVALAAREVQLAFAAVKQLAADIGEGPQPCVDRHRDRETTRLKSDEGGQRQEIGALPGQRVGLLPLGAALVDPLLEIEWMAESCVERRIARGDAFHAGAGVAVAISAGPVGGSGLLGPQRLTL